MVVVVGDSRPATMKGGIMAYFIKEVVNDEIGWPFVISREELERRIAMFNDEQFTVRECVEILLCGGLKKEAR